MIGVPYLGTNRMILVYASVGMCAVHPKGFPLETPEI